MTDQATVKAFMDAVVDATPSINAIVDFVNEHPELAHQETETAAFLVAQLRGVGYTVTEGIASIGIGHPDGWRYHTSTGANEFAGPAGKEVAISTAEVIGLSIITIGAATDF